MSNNKTSRMESTICLKNIKAEEDEMYDQGKKYIEIKIEKDYTEGQQGRKISHNVSESIDYPKAKLETEIWIEDHGVKSQSVDEDTAVLPNSSANINICNVELKPLTQLEEIPPEILIGGPDRRKTVQLIPEEEIIKLKGKLPQNTRKRVAITDILSLKPNKLFNNNVEVKKKKKFSCNECGQQFPQFSELKLHKIVHQVETRHKCDKCNKCFTRAHDLVLHARVHNGEKPYCCSYCDKQFSQKINKIRHERIHTNERPFLCPVCNEAFIDQGEVAKHLRHHSGEKPYFCILCKERFASQDEVRQHSSDVHTSTDGRHICTVCGASFKKRDSKNIHIREKHPDLKPFICDHCGKRAKVQIVIHMPVHTGIREWKCIYCDKTFASVKGKRDHEMRHSNVKPYGCPWCPYSFFSRNLLARHCRTHSDIRPFSCDKCSTTFKTKDALNRHVKMVHEQTINKFKCDFEGCGAKFSVKCNMYRHMRSSHYGLKPFGCSLCDASFTSKGSLICHEKSRHAMVKEEPCITCGKKFVDAKALRRHIAKKHANAVVLKQSYENPK